MMNQNYTSNDFNHLNITILVTRFDHIDLIPHIHFRVVESHIFKPLSLNTHDLKDDEKLNTCL